MQTLATGIITTCRSLKRKHPLPKRIEALKRWLEDELDFSEYTLNPASSDASFRR